MGFRFRKSVKAGPFRMTFSKSGVGYSVGGKGFRVTKKARGGIRTTASIPGTGISYVKDYGTGHSKTATTSVRTSTSAPASIKSKWAAFLLCVFFGAFGAHRFYVGKKGTGILWLFTCGMFAIGWITDCVSIFRGNFLDSTGHPLA